MLHKWDRSTVKKNCYKGVLKTLKVNCYNGILTVDIIKDYMSWATVFNSVDERPIYSSYYFNDQ